MTRTHLSSTCLAAVLLAATATFGQTGGPAAEPTVIFGIALGRPLPVLPACRSLYPSDPEPPCMTSPGHIKVFESKAKIITPEKIGNNIESVRAVWDESDFCELARERLDVKFGKPTSEVKGKAITRAGVEVAQTRTLWTLKDSTAMFMAPFSKVDNCWLTITTPVWDKAHPKEKAEF